MPDGFDIAALNQALAGTQFAGRIRHFPSLPSTNTLAMREAEQGAPAGTVYLADEQTAGRGRGGNQWRSEPGQGLYVSVLLRPAIAPADALWLSLAAGLAVQAAVAAVTTLQPDIRWPNDLLLSGKKFCGILTELNAEATRVRHAVVGIGINVHQPAFPPDLAALATSLAIETGREWARADLLLALLRALDQETSSLSRAGAMDQVSAGLVARLSDASTWVRGKRVTVDEGEPWSGVTEGLDARGFLRVRTPGGLRTVLSGGVRELPLSQVR